MLILSLLHFVAFIPLVIVGSLDAAAAVKDRVEYNYLVRLSDRSSEMILKRYLWFLKLVLESSKELRLALSNLGCVVRFIEWSWFNKSYTFETLGVGFHVHLAYCLLRREDQIVPLHHWVWGWHVMKWSCSLLDIVLAMIVKWVTKVVSNCSRLLETYTQVLRSPMAMLLKYLRGLRRPKSLFFGFLCRLKLRVVSCS